MHCDECGWGGGNHDDGVHVALMYFFMNIVKAKGRGGKGMDLRTFRACILGFGVLGVDEGAAPGFVASLNFLSLSAYEFRTFEKFCSMG